MVRMVHRNLFYRTELEICDEKSELWRKSKMLEGGKIENSGFRLKNGLLRVDMRPKLILNIF